MPKYIAFLRALNVGGHTVKMDRLRQLFEALGHANVETIIASGNVIFDSTSKSPPSLEKKIAAHLQESLGYEVATFIRTPSELATIVQYKPFSTADLNAAHALYIGFLTGPPSAAAIKKLQAIANEFYDFHVQGREVYWLCHKKFSASEFTGKDLEKTLGMATTLRNVTTVRKIVGRFSG